jgi:hypothetical protein
VRIHRPEVVVAARAASRVGGRDLVALLETPLTLEPPPRPRPEPPSLVLRAPPAPKPPKPAPDPALAAAQRRLIDRVEQLLAETEERLRGARFEEALRSAAEAREELGEVSQTAERRPREARLEVLAATALLALGREDDAQRSLGRAIAANPELTLDPMKTSPKVIRALAAARAEREER